MRQQYDAHFSDGLCWFTTHAADATGTCQALELGRISHANDVAGDEEGRTVAELHLPRCCCDLIPIRHGVVVPTDESQSTILRHDEYQGIAKDLTESVC